jgi:hypothetical protein
MPPSFPRAAKRRLITAKASKENEDPEEVGEDENGKTPFRFVGSLPSVYDHADDPFLYRKQILSKSTKVSFTVCFLIFLLVLISPAHAAEQQGSASADASFFVTFTQIGGTQPRCWNATTFQTLQEDTTATAAGDQIIRPTDLTVYECGSQTLLTIEFVGNQASVVPRLGWGYLPNQKVEFSIRGSLDVTLTTTEIWDAVMVLQLCPVGFNSLCSPILPGPPSSGTRWRLLQDEPAVEYVMDYEYLSISASEIVERQLVLRPPSAGIYSLMASLVVFAKQPVDDDELTGSSNIRGASIVPFSSSGAEQLIIVHEGHGEEPAVVDDWAVVLVLCFCGMGGLTLFSLLVMCIYYRKAQVFELTQGKFLMAMLVSGLVATCSLFLLEPKNDLYCQLFQPLVTLPMHIMFAILVGRMWRIRAIISPLLLLTLDKEEHWTSKVVNMVEELTRYEWFGNGVTVPGKKLRRAITDRQLLTVIIFLCLPQIIVQILIATIGDQKFLMEDGKDFSPEGYATCSLQFFDLLGLLSFVFVLLLFFILLVLAGSSRDLPSLFNETQSIWTVAVATFRMTVIGTLVVALTYRQRSGPTAQYLTLALLGGVTIVHTCVRITWAKVVAARKGNKIAVTRLIAAHNKTRMSHGSVNVRPSIEGLASSGYSNSSYGGFLATTGYSWNTTNRTELPSSPVSSELSTSVRENALKDPMLLDRIPDINLSTLHEEDEASYHRSTFEDEKKRQSVIQELSAEDHDDGNSTDSSVVMAVEENPQSYPGSLCGDGFQSGVAPFVANSSLRVSSESFSRVSTTSGVTSGYGAARGGAGLPHRAMFGRQASKARLNALDIEASIPPPLIAASSDSVVPSRGPRLDARPTLSVRDRARSQWRLPFLAGQTKSSHAGNPIALRSSDTTQRRPIRSRYQEMVPLTIEYNPRNKSDLIIVAKDVPPPRRLLLRMIDVQRRLARANNSILSGLGLDTTDWEGIRETCVALGEVFVVEVRFDWEPKQTHPQSEVALPTPYPGRQSVNAGMEKPGASRSLIEDSPESPQTLWRVSQSLIDDSPKSPQTLWRSSEGVSRLPVMTSDDSSEDDPEAIKDDVVEPLPALPILIPSKSGVPRNSAPKR